MAVLLAGALGYWFIVGRNAFRRMEHVLLETGEDWVCCVCVEQK